VAASFQIESAAGGRYGVALGEDYYLLSGGERLSVRARPAWCGACGRFVEAEWVRPYEEMARDLRELEYFAERPGLIPEDRPGLAWAIRGLEEERLRLRWRGSRIGPGRCLECGSAELVLFSDEGEADVPGVGRCRGRWIRFSGTGAPVRYFSPEGLPIAANGL
jgi:hypothetical protein